MDLAKGSYDLLIAKVHRYGFGKNSLDLIYKIGKIGNKE